MGNSFNSADTSFRVGEDILIALDAITGDPTTVSTIAAVLRPCTLAAGVPAFNPEIPGVAMTVTNRAAAPPIAAGWNLALLAASTTALPAGLYAVDAELLLGSGVVITDNSLIVQLTNSAIQ